MDKKTRYELFRDLIHVMDEYGLTVGAGLAEDSVKLTTEVGNTTVEIQVTIREEDHD